LYNVKEIGYSEWTTHLKGFQNTNLLQYWQYGAAKEETGNWKAVRFVVTDGDRVIGLAQFLARTLPVLGGIARLNRGPLLSKEIAEGERENVSCKALAALMKEAKKRFWWVVQIAPEIPESDTTVNALQNIGLKRLDPSPSASGLVSLSCDEETLLMSLKGKWRNCLRKGQKSGVHVSTVAGKSTDLYTLIDSYREIQQGKGFKGIPDSLIDALAKQEGEGWEFTLFTAKEEGSKDANESIGILVSLRHGDTSTYFIGTTNDIGRKLQVNYVLLWEAVLYAKRNGCEWFDIGGLNATTPKGIAHFKSGLNPDLYRLVGEWRGFIPPWKSTKNY
jgi:lipid II:glycine glycyltransferase (peptidoglycan interpeptide bridge formation enzyme)